MTAKPGFSPTQLGGLFEWSSCVAIAFADDEVHVGLQAADMVSYCERAYVARNVVPLDPLVGEIMARFGAQDRTDSSVFYRIEGNGLGDAILETE